MQVIRPMLAHPLLDTEITENLFRNGPLYIQPKFDGIRVQAVDGVLYSGRQGKLLPNAFCQGWASECLKGLHLDGEMVVYDQLGQLLPFADKGTVRGIESHLMSKMSSCRFAYLVFDDLGCKDKSYCFRLQRANETLRDLGVHCLSLIRSESIKDTEALRNLGQCIVDNGFEGYVLRSPQAKYKSGRSVLSELGMLKKKLFTDAEAHVIGFVEGMHNANEETKSMFGQSVRARKHAGLEPTGDLGALMVQSNDWPEPFNIGTGFTADERQQIWDNQVDLYGSVVTFKYQPHGSKDAPRSPVFLRFRHSD